jgi:predicted RNA-binding protein with RPS1 domain
MDRPTLGAFIQLQDDIDGLVHISQLSEDLRQPPV